MSSLLKTSLFLVLLLGASGYASESPCNTPAQRAFSPLTPLKCSGLSGVQQKMVFGGAGLGALFDPVLFR